jgi:hypothetical protein
MWYNICAIIFMRGLMSDHPLALDFVRFVLDSHPQTPWPALYDCMVNAAVMRRFRGLGLSELRAAGVPLSLSAMDELEKLIEEARRLLQNQIGQARPEPFDPSTGLRTGPSTFRPFSRPTATAAPPKDISQ